jgi:hypothetical protein
LIFKEAAVSHVFVLKSKLPPFVFTSVEILTVFSGHRPVNGSSKVNNVQEAETNNPAGKVDAPQHTKGSASPAPMATSYSLYKTAEERAAYIKQQAEQRMAERFAALGIRPHSKSTETQQQKQDRENRERVDRVRHAEAEDAKRALERQKRIEEELPAPPAPKPSGRKPAPPPPRRSRSDSVGQQADDTRKQPDRKQTDKEMSLRKEQQVQEEETKELELVDTVSLVIQWICTNTRRTETRLKNKKRSSPRSAKQPKIASKHWRNRSRLES